MKPPLLRIENLHVAFNGTSGMKEVLHGVDLQLSSGEALALVGASGSGKSVTAQAVMRLLGAGGSITKGNIFLEGTAIHTATEKEMNQIRGKKVGMIFQDPMTSLNPTMTVGKQIAEVLRLHEKLSSKQAKEKTIGLIDKVGIAHPKMRFDSYPFELSGGMRQRIVIAMAIAVKPNLLIADEPTTALDVTIESQIMDLLEDLLTEHRAGLLFITHDLNLARKLCSRVATMHRGFVVETGPIDSVFSSPKHLSTRHLIEGVCYVS